MKKIISANISKELADKLDTMSEKSFPHVSKSAIVEYALEKIDMTNFTKEDAGNGSEEKASSKKEASSKKRKEIV